MLENTENTRLNAGGPLWPAESRSTQRFSPVRRSSLCSLPSSPVRHLRQSWFWKNMGPLLSVKHLGVFFESRQAPSTKSNSNTSLPLHTSAALDGSSGFFSSHWRETT